MYGKNRENFEFRLTSRAAAVKIKVAICLCGAEAEEKILLGGIN